MESSQGAGATIARDEIRAAVAGHLGLEPDAIADHDDLIQLGLDSIRTMKLAGSWRKRGLPVNFAQLAAEPSVAAWHLLLGGSDEPAAPAAEPAAEPAAPAFADDGTPFGLAPMQHAYWVGRGEGQQLGAVAAHLYVEFDGADVDAGRLETAAAALIQRHPMLRTRFLGDGTQQTLDRPGRPVWSLTDLRAADAETAERTLEQLRDKRTHQLMAVEDGQVIDIALTLLPDGRTRLHLDVDMLAADAMSYRILVADLARLYHGEQLPAQDYTFREYLERHAAAAPEHEADRQWWQRRLPELAGAPELPLATAAGDAAARTVRLHRRLSPDAKARVFAAAHSRGITPAMALASVFAETIGGWSAQRRFLLNLPLFHREPVHPRVDGVVGDFTSSVLLEVDVTAPATVTERAQALQRELHAAGSHSGYSGLEVLRDLGRHRGEPVLAPIVYTSAINLGELFSEQVTETFGDPVWIISQGPQVLLDAQVTEVGGGLLLNWDIRADAFPAAMVETMFARYIDAVLRLAEVDADGRELGPAGGAGWDADAAVRIPLEQAVIRAQVNATDGPVTGRALHTGLFDHAASNPGAPAVIWERDASVAGIVAGSAVDAANGNPASNSGAAANGSPAANGSVASDAGVASNGSTHTNGAAAQGQSADADRVVETLTYGGLAAQALAIAGALRAAGVRPGDAVAVQLPKGPDQIVATVGVLAAGGVYVPIGFDQPAARRAEILRTGAVVAALTAGAVVPEVPTVALADARVYPEPLAEPVIGDPEGIAYVLFTSGSTGKPKGVEVPHRAAMNTIDDLNERFEIGVADRALALSALEFDLSVYDIFGLLSVGGAVVAVNDTQRTDPARWVELLRAHGVSVLNCVPSLLDMTLEAAAGQPLDSLRMVILGGDWVDVALPGRLAAVAPRARFAGLGGATETAIHSTICEVVGAAVPAEWSAVPYGTPLRNVRCRVVGPSGNDCPDWVTGELWIGGDGVAAGYRNDPERTADRFVVHEGLNWYRTGDLARYLPDGGLEFLGRADHQVKIRGYRVELGEVESALRALPGVRHAIAAIIGTAAPKLSAVVVPNDGVALAVPELLTAVGELLPAYMIPSRVELLAELPFTSNGKPDRKAIAGLLAVEDEVSEFVAPATDPERAVADIVATVLDRDRVGATDDFFALGGDSVLATAVIARVRDWLESPDAVVADFFAARTVTGLTARLLDRERRAGQAGRLAQVAALYLEVAAMTDDEVLSHS
ncbi:non-ribosomal peptide synthetase [Nocardia sp. NPDC055321]